MLNPHQTQMADLIRPPMDFLPPQPDRWVMQTAEFFLPLWLRYRCQITQIEVRYRERLVEACHQFLAGKVRLLFAFRHPTIDDQYGLVHLFSRVLPQGARSMGIPLSRPLRTHFVYDRGIPLWAGDIVTWLYPKMGGIPVYRSKADRQGLQAIRKILLEGEYPLAIAPEGGTNGCSELIRKLEPGVAQIGFWCAEDLEKAGRSEAVWIIPLGFQYQYLSHDWKQIDQFLVELEGLCGMVTNLPQTSQERYQRLAELGNYLINYVSQHYQKFYPIPLPSDLGAPDLETRLNALLEHILTIAEYHFGAPAKGDVTDRCRRVEQAVWDQIFRSDIKDIRTLSVVEKGFANHLAQEARSSEWHMRIAESLTGVTGTYVRDHPSPTRFAETLLLIWRALNRVQSRPFGRQPHLGNRSCLISIGEPIAVIDRYPLYRSSRTQARECVQQLTDDLHQAMLGLIMSS